MEESPEVDDAALVALNAPRKVSEESLPKVQINHKKKQLPTHFFPRDDIEYYHNMA